jgi:hypothetical protein
MLVSKSGWVKQAAYFTSCFSKQQFLRVARNKLASQQVSVVPNRTYRKLFHHSTKDYTAENNNNNQAF